jgi:hypothetical protein
LPPTKNWERPCFSGATCEPRQCPELRLSDGYSKLAPAADNPNTSLWISQDFDFKPYRKILLDQVEVFVSPTSEYQGVSPDVLKGMADRFRDSFKKALQPDYQFVDEPGPGVLHIRLAITGVNLVHPGFQVANVLPVLFVLRTISGANQARNVTLTAEMEVRGSSEKVVAQALLTGTGDRTVRPDRDLTWQDVRGSPTTGTGLRRRLDEARGVAFKVLTKSRRHLPTLQASAGTSCRYCMPTSARSGGDWGSCA